VPLLEAIKKARDINPGRLLQNLQALAANSIALKVGIDTGDDYGGARNELYGALEASGKWTYEDGDDRYYRLKLFVPSSGFSTSSSAARNDTWHVFFQFHHLGNTGTPPLSLSLIKKSGIGTQPFEFKLELADPYTSGSESEVWLTDAKYDTWLEFVLHVYWSSASCTLCDPEQPDGGLVELWLNKSPAFASPLHAKTLPTCPAAGSCGVGVQSGDVEPVYLKMGIYRDATITGPAKLFFQNITSATKCRNFFPTGCPR
jgi:hypothetical protein